MDFNDIEILFKRYFPCFQVAVIPPCISNNREWEYIMRAKQHALGLLEEEKVKIDNENKMIYYYR